MIYLLKYLGDDVILYREINSEDDTLIQQEDLNMEFIT